MTHSNTGKLIGVDPGKLQEISSNPEAQCPDLLAVEELYNSFKRWEQQPGFCSIMAVCIASAACKAGTSWLIGHVLLLPNGAEVHACYVGADKPKLLFLMDCKQCNYPFVTVVAATVDSPGLPLGTLPRWGHSCWKIRGGHQDPDFVIEQRDGQWIMNIGTWHTQTQGCPTCQLCHIGRLVACPWHKGPGTTLDSTSLRVVHMVCEKDDNTSVVCLKGGLDHLPEGGNFWIFHVCTQQQILQLGKRYLPSQSPAELLSLPSRRAHLLGSTVMPYLPHFDKFLFHPSISGTSLSRLVVKLLPSMFGSQGAIVKTWIGYIAVPL